MEQVRVVLDPGILRLRPFDRVDLNDHSVVSRFLLNGMLTASTRYIGL